MTKCQNHSVPLLKLKVERPSSSMFLRGCNYANPHTTQMQFSTHSIHSQNLYQIFAYVKNLAAKGCDVSGILLYAGTDEEIQPNQKYTIAGNCIRVQTLNLNCDFSEIYRQLNEIAEQFMAL